MYEEENLSPAEQALESTLSQLKPTTNTLNRDTLMFNAGRASVGRKRPWQLLSGILTILLLWSLLTIPESNEIRDISPEPESSGIRVTHVDYQPVKIESHDSLAYPVLRDDIVKNGLDAVQLKHSAGHNIAVENRKQLIEEMLSL